MNIHFVYAGDVNNDSEMSPYAITRNLYRHLLTKFDNVYYYNLDYTGDPINYDRNDIVLAHPNYDHNTIGRKLFNLDFKVKASIHPLHHRMPEFNRPFHDIVDKVDVIFSIMGPYWYDTLDSTEFSHWKDKMVRLDMCVNNEYYKYQKVKFNDKGNRTFVYVGNHRVEKGIETLYQIFKDNKYKLDIYGGVDHRIINLPNVENHGRVHVNGDFGKLICDRNDFFINTSISDANPTTCTEAAAFGLPVVCTRGSGYWPNEPFYNIEENNYEEVINNLQNTDDSVLFDRSIKQRKWVEESCNYELFCNKITEKLYNLYEK